MSWDRDRKLHLAGGALAVLVLLSLGLAVFGAIQASSQEPGQGPGVEWSLERVNETHFEMTHDGGPTVHSEDVALRVDGQRRPAPFSGTVSEGDAGVVPGYSGAEVRIFWTGGQGDWVRMHQERI